MNKGKLIVISGPSGAGKGTVIKQVLRRKDNVALSVSCTTRAPRPGEQEGVDYYYVSKEKFAQMIEEDGFLEYESFFDNSYGTPEEPVRKQLAQGINVILEIDVKGGMNIKKKVPEAELIFIAPPSMEILRSRLVGRKTETPDQIEKRTKRAFEEMQYQEQYDYVVVNDDLQQAVQQVIDIIEK
ncbi:MAG: guanylate kinase [Clostridiales bacterium]|nr:MAG: guanylate kinase [Clostridiales bacterium]